MFTTTTRRAKWVRKSRKTTIGTARTIGLFAKNARDWILLVSERMPTRRSLPGSIFWILP